MSKRTQPKPEETVFFSILPPLLWNRIRRELVPSAGTNGMPVSTEDAYCWIWTGRLSKNGYGRFRLNGKEIAAHRLVWQLYIGHLPESIELDHKLEICTSRACCNPLHLQRATPKQNSRARDRRRGRAKTVESARKAARARWAITEAGKKALATLAQDMPSSPVEGSPT